jgi:hypothetical protein
MKRRRFFQTLAVVPAAALLPAQQQPAAAGNQPGRPQAEEVKIETAVADQAGEMVLRFFSPQQFAALHKLSDILMPSLNGVPGALDAKAAEFLDFLIGASTADRQQVYRAGLDALNTGSAKRYQKPFAELDASQADALLEPLRAPWTFEPPRDPLARFLAAAKQDVRTATVNSREYNTAGGGGGRRTGGGGLYWYPID